MSSRDGDADRSGLWRSLADLVVYAPIGLTLDAQDLAPDLARRGRQHTAAARQIGEFAVRAGMRRLDDLVVALDPSRAQARSPNDATGPEPAAEPSTPAATSDHAAPAADPPGATGVDSGPLAIPDYDLLAASQVVKRLDGLDAAQLDAIRRHEEAGRGRRTILHKISRLQSR